MSLKRDPQRFPSYRPVQLGEEVPFGQAPIYKRDAKGTYMINALGQKVYVNNSRGIGGPSLYEEPAILQQLDAETTGQPIPIEVEDYKPSTGTGSTDQTQQSTFSSSVDPNLVHLMNEQRRQTLELARYENDPKRYEELISVLEPFEARRAQRQQELGLQSQAVGFALKGLPDMLMKAYASRAAYYPEMIRGTVDGLTRGFDSGASAAKPRFDYYSGLIT